MTRTLTHPAGKACRHDGFTSDATASFCGECGATLMRCMAHETCGGLVDATGMCSSCISPQLFLDAGAVQNVTAGGAVALPLLLANASPAGRTLFVTGTWTRSGGQWDKVDLVWDRLDAGAVQPLIVRASTLDRAGSHQLEVLIAVTTRWKWREETFLLSSSLAITAEGGQSINITQNITNAGGDGAMGGANYAPIRVDTGSAARPASDNTSPRPLALVHAGAKEIDFRLRGMESGVRVLRGVEFRWRGFGPTEHPPAGPICAPDALLTFGRARTRQRGGQIDARISLLTPQGALDVEGSNHLSRRHFDLYLENDRLHVRAESEAGLGVNGKNWPRGTPVALRDGDIITPLHKAADRLAVRVAFETHSEGVVVVTLTRTPKSPEGEG